MTQAQLDAILHFNSNLPYYKFLYPITKEEFDKKITDKDPRTLELLRQRLTNLETILKYEQETFTIICSKYFGSDWDNMKNCSRFTAFHTLFRQAIYGFPKNLEPESLLSDYLSSHPKFWPSQKYQTALRRNVFILTASTLGAPNDDNMNFHATKISNFISMLYQGHADYLVKQLTDRHPRPFPEIRLLNISNRRAIAPSENTGSAYMQPYFPIDPFSNGDERNEEQISPHSTTRNSRNATSRMLLTASTLGNKSKKRHLLLPTSTFATTSEVAENSHKYK